jgi:hypothetical protein
VCLLDGMMVSAQGQDMTAKHHQPADGHAPVPVDIDSADAQRAILSAAREQARRQWPAAVSLVLAANDDTDGLYGFTIVSVLDANGEPIGLGDSVATVQNLEMGHLYNLNWSERGGLVGEDQRGDAVLSIDA